MKTPLRSALAIVFASCSLAANETPSKLAQIDLPTTLRLAGAQNLDVRIARERLNEARAQYESAREQFFPWLSPSVGFRRHDGRTQAVDGPIIDVSKQSYNAGASLTAQVDLGDAYYKNLAARQLVHAADHAFDAQRQDAILAAAQGYFNLLRAQASVGVAREALRISEEYERETFKAVEIGVAFKGDALRVRVETERIRLALRQAFEQQRVAAARLAQILRLDSKIDLTANDADLAPLSLIPADATLDALVGQALSSRPELKQSRSLVAAARDTKAGTIYGPMIPTVGAQVFAGGLGGGVNDDTGHFGHSEDYFVGASWRVGPGGLFDFGRIHAAEARLRSAQLTGDKLQDEITREVVEARTRVESLTDQLGTTRRALASAEETLRLTRQRKQFAVGNVLENIQAEQELTRVRNDYLSTIAELNKEQYALSKATGNLMSHTRK